MEAKVQPQIALGPCAYFYGSEKSWIPGFDKYRSQQELQADFRHQQYLPKES